MLIYCYDEQLQLTGVIDEFQSYDYTRSFTGVGDFTLIINKNDLDVIKQSAYIRHGPMCSGVITSISETVDQTGESITVSGTELKGIAQKRIILPFTASQTAPETVIATLLNTQLINPANANRAIVSTLAAYDASSTKINYEAQYVNLANEIQSLCETYSCGWAADIVNGQIVWYILHGTNRTTDQTTNEPMILAVSFDTLAAETHTTAINDTKNTAIVCGDTQGSSRTTAIVGDSNTGIGRNEVYVDARNDENTNLTTKGNEALASYGDSQITTVTPSVTENDRYKTVYDLGDVGTLADRNINAALTEVTETYANNQLSLAFTLGLNANTLQGAVKRMVANYTTVSTANPVTGGGSGGGAVDSVNGKTGVVVLNNTDVGAAPTTHTHSQSDVTGLVSALNAKISEPISEGTAGQVLTTNGSGGRTWTTVSGGGGISDTGWIDLTLASGFTAWSTNIDLPQYRKYGNVVYVRGAVKNNNTIAANTYAEIATLPTGFYSTSHRLQMPCMLAFNGYAKNCALYVDQSTGKLQFRHMYTSTLSSGQYISLCCSFMVD